MPPFWSRRPIKPEMVTPPVEPQMRRLPVDPVTAQLIEAQARLRHAARLIEVELHNQARRADPRGRARNAEVVDLCLELRSTLQPSPGGSMVPVVPGRST